MAQRLVTADVNTNIPGAYPVIKVQSNPVGLGSSGLVVIIGEADGGADYSNESLKDNSFSPDQFARVKNKYLSGQIVDAFSAFTAPSNDADIVGSASRIFILKTNASTQASAIVDTDYGTYKDQNYGVKGNQYKFQHTSTAAETAPAITGTVIAAFGAPLNGLTFAVRLNGGASTQVTLSGTAGDHSTISLLASEITAQLPAGMTAVAGAVANSLKFIVTADAAAYRKGWGKSFELVDTDPGDLAAIGHTAGQTVSSQEPGIEVAISRSDIGLSETKDVNSVIALEIGYVGTTCTMTINKTTKTLTTAKTGGTGANLSIDLSQYRTLADLAAYIAAQTGYSCSVPASSQQLQTSDLDAVTAIDICATAAGVKPGRVKNASASFQRVLATSRAFSFTATATAGLPNPMALPAFLSGGTRGNTLAADVVAAIEQLAGIQCNIIVPLFSRDATADITEGHTSSGSTYTIDAVHAAVKTHCLQYSTPELKRNRTCILSFWGTYTQSKAKAQTLASYRASLTCQKVTQNNSEGITTNFLPWYAACVAAGMQTGGFYKAIFNKAANVTSFEDPTGFDSGSPGDVEDALSAGLLILASDTTRNYWVSDQSTYGYDTNFVYNSIQAVYCSDILALDLADSFQKAFVGKSLADVDAATGLSYLAQKMDFYKKVKLIASSDDAPLGWKNGKIDISAPTMEVQVEVKLSTAIYFVPLNISFSQVQSAA